jgi:dethiobiotin synthetase
MEGVMIVGSDRQCGKTVVTAGLACALAASGFHIQAFKPLGIGPAGDEDQQYIDKITQQFSAGQTLKADSPHEVSTALWHRMMEQLKSTLYPCLIEAPGQVAMLWRMTGQPVDALDIAQTLGLSVLLTTRADDCFMEKTRSALSFISGRGVSLLGFIAVQTQPGENAETIGQEAFIVSQEFKTPVLGSLPYSPSIQVSLLQQGNLLRLVEENIDLLPLQMGMGIML